MTPWQCTFDDYVFDSLDNSEAKLCTEKKHTIIRILDDDEKKKALKKIKDEEETLDARLEKVELDESEDVLNDVIKLFSKTIKEDVLLISHILFNGLSCFTKNPNNLMIMEKTSEGKTYPVLEIAKHFPLDNVITIGNISPQAFKYDHGVLVNDSFTPIQIELDFLNERIDEEKDKRKKFAYEKRRKILLRTSQTLIDFQLYIQFPI